MMWPGNICGQETEDSIETAEWGQLGLPHLNVVCSAECRQWLRELGIDYKVYSKIRLIAVLHTKYVGLFCTKYLGLNNLQKTDLSLAALESGNSRLEGPLPVRTLIFYAMRAGWRAERIHDSRWAPPPLPGTHPTVSPPSPGSWHRPFLTIFEAPASQHCGTGA